MSVLQEAPLASAAGGRVVLHEVSWDEYERFLAAVGDRTVRLTYDRGRLEIMAPLWNHEWWARRADHLILALGLELNLEIQGGGSTTFRREDLERGLEPDECYYIRNAHKMLGLRVVDLSRDPPPDLAVEIDITHSSLDRLAIYAALGVPEVWRIAGMELAVHVLQANGEYQQQQTSLSFPALPIGEVYQLLANTGNLSDTAMQRHFQQWVRERVLGVGR